MSLTLETVQSLAPDQASLQAAGGLRKPAKWPLRARNQSRDLAWGECQGSGATPYRISVALDDRGYKCTCPSRKLPCKHVLALLWMVVDAPGAFGEAPVPDWVEDWVSRRKKKSTAPRPSAAAPKDIAAVTEAAVEPVDPKRAAAAEKAAEKRREDREASILAGLDELERWLSDVLGDGLAAFPSRAVDRCRKIAARLVDAKAGALGTRLDELPKALFSVPDEDRPGWLLGELGRIALLAKAYRRRDKLPPPLAEDVRRLVGWTTTREDLLEDAGALRVADTWTVLAVRTETQSDHLVRHETWLRRHGEGTPDFGLLIDYVPVAATAAAPTYRPGEVFAAELVFYPSAAPLRALMARRDAAEAPPENALHGGHPGLDAAVAAAQRLVARQPWLDPIPVVVRDARIGRFGEALVVHSEDGAALKIWTEDLAPIIALGAAGAGSVALLLDQGGVRLLAADTPLGWWAA